MRFTSGEILKMLFRIFTAIGAVGAGLHTLIAGQDGGAMKVTGVLILRFFEYFIGSQLAYVILMLLSTELFIRLDEPQERPSKFWKWHMREVAKMICLYSGAQVIVTGREKLPRIRDTFSFQTTARCLTPSLPRLR